MTTIDYIRRVARYGVKGVVLWLRIKIGDHRHRRFFFENAKCLTAKPQRGVTLVGPFAGSGSLNKVMRDLLFSVRDTGIPFQAYNTSGNDDLAKSGFANLITPVQDFKINKYSLIIDLFDGVVPDVIACRHANIVFWEFEDGFLPVYPAFARKTEVIGMSDFVVRTMQHELPPSVKVSKLLYPFRPSFGELPPRQEMRRRFDIPEEAFVVFFNFDFSSGFDRKNPDGAMRAFAEAFRNDQQAVLVFKTNNSSRFPGRVESLSRLAAELGIADRFIMIHNYISNVDIYGLTSACDVYLSLHRGEGFGLGVAEAMALGLSVVVSDYSSTTEFCNSNNSILIPCRIVKLGKGQIDHLTYTYVTKWAEPDISLAADALRRLRNDVALRAQIQDRAKRDIAEHFSISNFRASLEALL